MDQYCKERPIRFKVFTLLNVGSKDTASLIVQTIIVSVIIICAISLILESVDQIQQEFAPWFTYFNHFSIGFFTVEYLLRMWSITCDPKYRKLFSGRVSFGFTAMQLIDLFAILPFYLSFWHVDLRIIRLLRVFKLLRIFHIARYISALNLVVKVVRRKMDQLILVVVMLFFLLLIASSAMYYSEHAAQPEAFSSIPESMWWSIITLTTVGYGDIYPITIGGRIIGGLIAIIGIGFFALPAGILASGFSEELNARFAKEKPGICPMCNSEIKP